MHSVWELQIPPSGLQILLPAAPQSAQHLRLLRSHRRWALHGRPQIAQSLPHEQGDALRIHHVRLLITLRDVPACDSAPAAWLPCNSFAVCFVAEGLDQPTMSMQRSLCGHPGCKGPFVGDPGTALAIQGVSETVCTTFLALHRGIHPLLQRPNAPQGILPLTASSGRRSQPESPPPVAAHSSLMGRFQWHYSGCFHAQEGCCTCHCEGQSSPTGTLQTTFSSQASSQCLRFMHRKAAATATVAGKLRARGRQCQHANRPADTWSTSGVDGIRACCM